MITKKPSVHPLNVANWWDTEKGLFCQMKWKIVLEEMRLQTGQALALGPLVSDGARCRGLSGHIYL